MSADGRLQEALRLHQAGRAGRAEALYRQILAGSPADVAANNLLGLLYLQTGRADDAIAPIRRGLAAQPDDPQAHYNLGLALKDAARLEDSARHFAEAGRLAPGNAEAHNALGNILRALGRHEEAIGASRKVLSLQPGFAAAHRNVGNSQLALGRVDQAVASLRKAVELAPDFADAHNDLGAALNASGNTLAAIPSFREALRLAPGNPSAWINLGISLEQAGEMSEAEACFRETLRLDPDFAAAHFHLARLSGSEPDSQQVDAMHALYERLDESAPDRALLAFGLGAALEKQAQYARSFEFFRAGHRLKRRQHTFDLAQQRRNVDEIMEKARVVDAPAAPDGGEDLLLIVGMPRSGTSLTEQILASHAEVHGAGESRAMVDVVRHSENLTGSRFPDNFRQLSSADLVELGKTYRSALPEPPAGVTKIVDTTPMNFLHLGLAAAVLPGARFVHCVRDPMDTCLSIYQHPLSEPHSYAHELADLGGYYRLYRELMTHWQSVLPGRIFDSAYEALVTDTEDRVRRLLEFCGLPFDPACLEFQQTRRAVRTPSAGQVRQPIYTDSVGRWRRYEQQLGPLRDALGDIGG